MVTAMSEPQSLRAKILATVEDEAMTIADISRATYDGQDRCPECQRSTDAFSAHTDEVRAIMRELLSNNRIMSTPDWHYKKVNRGIER